MVALCRTARLNDYVRGGLRSGAPIPPNPTIRVSAASGGSFASSQMRYALQDCRRRCVAREDWHPFKAQQCWAFAYLIVRIPDAVV